MVVIFNKNLALVKRAVLFKKEVKRLIEALDEKEERLEKRYRSHYVELSSLKRKLNNGCGKRELREARARYLEDVVIPRDIEELRELSK